MHCLWCHEEIIPEITWVNVWNPSPKRKTLCDECEKNLTPIKGTTCPRCNKPTSKKEFCADCMRWMSHPQFKDVLLKNTSIFSYSPFLKEIMNKWKYRGDYVLINIFSDLIANHFKTHYKEKITLVPIPLSEERWRERGFNQAEAIASQLPFAIRHPLRRVQNEKQAKKSRKERLQQANPFTVKESISGHVVLVDDLYTTGATLHWAAYLLKEAGAEKVESFTLIRS
jgi:competence protein ComFC